MHRLLCNAAFPALRVCFQSNYRWQPKSLLCVAAKLVHYIFHWTKRIRIFLCISGDSICETLDTHIKKTDRGAYRVRGTHTYTDILVLFFYILYVVTNTDIRPFFRALLPQVEIMTNLVFDAVWMVNLKREPLRLWKPASGCHVRFTYCLRSVFTFHMKF